jgi:transcription antitermination factor NusG
VSSKPLGAGRGRYRATAEPAVDRTSDSSATERFSSDGGEALPRNQLDRFDVYHEEQRGLVTVPRWFVLGTRSHCERTVCDQLVAHGFESFLPTIRTWSRQQSTRKIIALPMFPGYVFVRHAIDKHSYADIVKTRGAVRLLGEGCDRLAPVPDAEVGALQRIVETQVFVFPHPYLREGQPVRITAGPLEGVEGTLVQFQSKPHKGLLVVSVDLLQRSVAIEVDRTQVVPVAQSSTQRPGSRGVWRSAFGTPGSRHVSAAHA